MVPTPVFTHDGEDVSFESRSFSADMKTDLTPTLGSQIGETGGKNS